MNPFEKTPIAIKESAIAHAVKVAAISRGYKADDCDIECPKMDVEACESEQAGNVLVIKIRGCMMRDCEGWFPYMTDVVEVMDELEEADSDANVSAIVLDIDSPGGTFNGSWELAQSIAALTKPVVAFTAGCMDSAAYLVGAACDYIIAAPSSSVGSIGVYVAMLDQSSAFEMAGLKTVLIKSGTYKGAGIPGTSLSEDQYSYIQNQVDTLHSTFKGFVSQYRETVPAEAMEGQDFLGFQAIEVGLVDELGSFQNAVQAAQFLATI